MNALRAASLAVVLMHAGAAAAQSTTIPSWTTYQGNARHDGYVPTTLDPSTFRVEWTTTINGSLAIQPITAADGLVFASQYGYFSSQGLYVLSAADGSTLWSQTFQNIYSVNPPAYDDGKVYIQTVNNSGDTWVRGYDATSGQPLFQSAAAAQWERYLAPTIVDHTLYMNGGYFGGMYSMDSISGTQNWFTALPQYDQWTPAVDAQYAYGYVGGTFHAVARDSGAIAWQFVDSSFSWSGYDMNQATALGSQQDALNVNGGRLLSFDLAGQRLRWQKNGGFTAQPAIAGETIYAVANGTLVALDEASGDQLWMWSASNDTLSGPVIVTDSHAFVSSSDNVYAVDLATHTKAWSYPVGGSLALSDGHLYIATTDGRVISIEASDTFIKGADLALALRASDVSSTTQAAYALVATTRNLGPADATHVKLSIRVPRGFGIKTLDPACTYSASTLNCTALRLAANAQLTIKNELLPRTRGKRLLSASVSAQQDDPRLSNNRTVYMMTVQ